MSERTIQHELRAACEYVEWDAMYSLFKRAADKIAALESALASQTRHATTLGAALSNSQWQEDAWTDVPQLVYRPSCRPAPQRMESML